MKTKRKRRFDRPVSFALDGNGVAVRALPDAKAVSNWLDKHFPGLDPAEKRRRTKTFGDRRKAKAFFEEQIAKGCSDPDVLSFILYCDGTATSWRLDFRRGRVISAEEREARRTGAKTGRTIKT